MGLLFSPLVRLLSNFNYYLFYKKGTSLLVIVVVLCCNVENKDMLECFLVYNDGQLV